MTKRRASVVAGLAVLLVGFSRPAVAQFASSIEGTVTDSSGAIVPGATVTVLNEDAGTEQSVTTTSAGYYRVPALPAALYTVRATLSGFKTVVQEHIRLQVAETKTINITL
jgi:Carboxypeptidase regulatory-like domain